MRLLLEHLHAPPRLAVRVLLAVAAGFDEHEALAVRQQLHVGRLLALPPVILEQEVVDPFQAGGHVHAGRGAVADQMQPVQVVGGHRLLEPRHAEVGEQVGERQRFLAGVGAVGVHNKLCFVSDGGTGGPNPVEVFGRVRTDFHLHARDSLRRPAGQLVPQTPIGVRSETAAAVDRHGVAGRPEERDERQIQ